MDEILQELVPVMKKEFPRRPPSNENLYEYYMSRVKYNLHVALCFSPVSLIKLLFSNGKFCDISCNKLWLHSFIAEITLLLELDLWSSPPLVSRKS